MEQCEVIKNQLKRIGNTVYLKDGDWVSMPFRASLSRLWRKKSSEFERDITEIGEAESYYYLYVGPYNHDITTLSEHGLLLFNGERYEFKCKDPVLVDDRIAYYSAILRKLNEEVDYEI